MSEINLEKITEDDVYKELILTWLSCASKYVEEEDFEKALDQIVRAMFGVHDHIR